MKNVAHIRATGVLNEFSYQVAFQGEGDAGRIRVVYAPNGRGKTNFLRGVSYLLVPSVESMQALVDVPVRALSIDFEGGGSISLNRKTAFAGSYELTVVTPTEDGDIQDVAVLQIEPSDFAGRMYRRVWEERDDFSQYVSLVMSISTGATLIGDDRLSPVHDDIKEGVRVEPASFAAKRRPSGSVSKLLDRVERMLSQAAFAGLSRETASGGVYSQITKTTLAGSRALNGTEARAALEQKLGYLLSIGSRHEQYGLVSLRQLRDIRSQLHAARLNARNLGTLHRILTPYLDSLQDQVESLSPALQLIDTFVNGVNGFLERKELQFSATHGVALVNVDGSKLQPDSLSSGERHLIYLMSHALLSTAERPLVVIDEPELSLGLEWQRDLLPGLLRCSASSGVQFLIASHSLQILNAVPRDEIIRPAEDL